MKVSASLNETSLGFSEKKLIGVWSLLSFEIKSNQEPFQPWGKNIHGMLIYTENNYVSVSINRERAIDDHHDIANEEMNNILFYSGTFWVKGSVVGHEVKNASDSSRIGKTLERTAKLQDDLLTLVSKGDDFEAVLVWKRN